MPPVVNFAVERPDRPPPRPLLGEVLHAAGVPQTAIAAALARQKWQDARLGQLLIAEGAIGPEDLLDALAQQYHLDRVGPAQAADPHLLRRLNPVWCLRHKVVPLGRERGIITIATAEPERLAALMPVLSAQLGPVRTLLTCPTELHRMIASAAGPDLVHRAETRVAAPESCRSLGGVRTRLLAGLILFTCLAAVMLWPGSALSAGLILALGATFANTILNLAILARHPHAPSPRRPPPSPGHLLPRILILVPLYDERDVSAALISRLERLTYPRALLEIRLVVEDHDSATRKALENCDLPHWIAALVVPRGTLRTKPRALNFALDFCTGSLVGVYDAEDMPAPDQLERVAAHFAGAAPLVACLQGRLDFYNPRANWMARCFAVEYAAWFGVVLPGLARLGFVVPLGGTTLFFRRTALVALGGWDAHNVTEDADLGVRLARHGYRTELLESATLEEANCRPWPWVRQRARWIKGYALTWAVHNRHPVRLLRDLGAWRFLGVQVLFLGTILGFFCAPLLWSLWFLTLGLAHPWTGLPPVVIIPLGTALFLTALVSAAVQMAALRDAGKDWLRWTVPSLQVYYLLATIAAWRGLAQCATRPFHWDKTAHGVSPPAAQAIPPPG